MPYEKYTMREICGIAGTICLLAAIGILALILQAGFGG